ncbi:MAG: ADP-ribose 1''-phosphate phosphatase [Cirrosporium novae-zelandiae]|nr:MAG: ADP-ribose 1''-phosphate phosphatase [Cirrosporium novae-zelandiae]
MLPELPRSQRKSRPRSPPKQKPKSWRRSPSEPRPMSLPERQPTPPGMIREPEPSPTEGPVPTRRRLFSFDNSVRKKSNKPTKPTKYPGPKLPAPEIIRTVNNTGPTPHPGVLKTHKTSKPPFNPSTMLPKLPKPTSRMETKSQPDKSIFDALRRRREESKKPPPSKGTTPPKRLFSNLISNAPTIPAGWTSHTNVSTIFDEPTHNNPEIPSSRPIPEPKAVPVKKGIITERYGNIFDVPSGPNKVLLHACNCQGSWGAGVAAGFKTNYPAAYSIYHKRSRTPTLLGHTLLIPPQYPDVASTNPRTHWIGCLYTKPTVGASGPKSSPEEIVDATASALESLKGLLEKLKDQLPKEGGGRGDAEWELHIVRINSGIFNVKWERSVKALVESGLDFTVWVPKKDSLKPGVTKGTVRGE